MIAEALLKLVINRSARNAEQVAVSLQCRLTGFTEHHLVHHCFSAKQLAYAADIDRDRKAQKAHVD